MSGAYSGVGGFFDSWQYSLRYEMGFEKFDCKETVLCLLALITVSMLYDISNER